MEFVFLDLLRLNMPLHTMHFETFLGLWDTLSCFFSLGDSFSNQRKRYCLSMNFGCFAVRWRFNFPVFRLSLTKPESKHHI